MASRRTAAGRRSDDPPAYDTSRSQTRLLPDGTPISGAPGPSDTRPSVPRAVIFKLLAFTLAMVALPIGSYFALHALTGSSTVGGAVAALVANLVLFAYIFVAFQEDMAENGAGGVGGEGKKSS